MCPIALAQSHGQTLTRLSLAAPDIDQALPNLPAVRLGKQTAEEIYYALVTQTHKPLKGIENKIKIKNAKESGSAVWQLYSSAGF